MNKWSRRTFLCGVVILCVLAFYVGSFIWRFDIFSDAVRDNQHGWLGPAIRGDSHTVNIGKVNYYEGTNYFAYRTYRPLCKVWLWVMGFSD
jgi:hypothetical protein